MFSTKDNSIAYRPDVDGLRAVAVMSVVFYHAFPTRLPGGFIGVDIFFVISGYLISSILYSELEARTFSFQSFYARRIRRLFPSLVLVLLATCLFGWFTLLPAEYMQLGKHVLSAASFMSNFVFWSESGYFDSESSTKLLLHLWSLGIEEQFYIFWPLILWLASRYRVSFAVLISTLFVLSLGLSIREVFVSSAVAFYSPIMRMWELLAGALLARHASSVSLSTLESYGVGSLQRSALSLGGLALIVISMFAISRESLFPGFWAVVPVVGAVLIIFAGPHAWLNRVVLSNPIAIFFGLISYPLYLWHWPILTFAKILFNHMPPWPVRLLLVGASCLVAWGTYALVEKPLRRNVTRAETQTRWLLAAMAALASFGLVINLSGGAENRAVAIDSAYSGPMNIMDAPPELPCVWWDIESKIMPFCTRFSGPNPTKTIFLWGDSTTTSLLPAFNTIAKENNFAIVNLSHFSCPPILNVKKTKFVYEPSKSYCSDGAMQTEVLAYIRSVKPDVIVLAGAWTRYLTDEFIAEIDDRAANRSTAERVISNQLPVTLRTLASDFDVVVIKSWPIMPEDPIARVVKLLNIYKKDIGISRADFAETSAPIGRAIDSLHNLRVRAVDPLLSLCSDMTCFSEKDGIPLYSDRYHLAPLGAMLLKCDLLKAIKTNVECMNSTPSTK